MNPIPNHRNLRDIVSRYSLCEVYAFGSRADDALSCARGNKPECRHSDSDIDIGVRCKPGTRLSARQRAGLVLDLEEFFEVRRVDVVFLEEAEPFLALEIISGHLLFSGDMESQAHYELYVMRRAGDLLPFKKQRVKMILEGEGR